MYIFHQATVIYRFGSFLLIALALLPCCNGSVPTTTQRPAASQTSCPLPPPPPKPIAAFPVAPGQTAFGRVYSARFQLSLPLPDPDGWKVNKERSSFLVLHHRTSSSSLVVRLWQEDENMNRAKCEERARLRRDFPKRSGEKLVDSRDVGVPPDFDTRIDVGFTRQAPDAPIRGYALAFGGWKRNCFAYVYTTEAAGPDAEQIVGDRLAVLQSRGLAGVERRHSTDIAPTRRP